MLIAAYDDVIVKRGRRVIEVAPGVRTIAEVISDERGRLALPPGPLAILADGEPADADDRRLASGVARLQLAPRPEDAGTVGLFVVSSLFQVASTLFVTRDLQAPVVETTPEEERPAFARFASPAIPGDKIPVVFGAVPLWGGKLLSSIPVDSTDGSGTGVLRMLMCMGHGPFRSIGGLDSDVDGVDSETISGVYVNDNPISDYPGARVWTRLGTETQSPITGFDDVERLEDVAPGLGELLANDTGASRTGPAASSDAVLYSTADVVDAVRLRVRFTEGLFVVGDSGTLDTRRVRWRARIRTSDTGGGAGAWSAWRVATVERAERSEFVSELRLEAVEPGVLHDVQAERVDPASPTSDVTASDVMYFEQVVEVQDTNLNYPGVALLAIELPASEQLTSVPRVSADVEGLANLRVWDGQSDLASPQFTRGYSANPAWAVLEMLTNTAWGFGAAVGDARIDTRSLIEWAQTCDELVDRVLTDGQRRRYELNIALREGRSPRELLRVFCAAGRCVPAFSGDIYRFVAFRPQTVAVDTITDREIIATDDSGVPDARYMREATTGGLVRPNQIVAQFESTDEDGELDEVEAPPLGTQWLTTELVRSRSVRLEGVTDREQASALANHYVKRERYLGRTVEFKVAMPAMVIEPGDRFDLALRQFGYGIASGALRGATETTVRLDQEVTLEAGTTYVVRTVADDGTAQVRTISSPAGDYADGAELTVSQPFAPVPLEFNSYAFGADGLEAKPFMATRVELDSFEDLTWRVEAIEYDERIDDDDEDPRPVPPYGVLNPRDEAPGPVFGLRLTSEPDQSPPRIVLSWQQRPQDEQRTSSFLVYRRRIGTQTFVVEPNAFVSRAAAVVDLPINGVAFEYAVVAVSSLGSALSPGSPRVPKVEVFSDLASPPPPPPSNPTATLEADGTYTLTADPREGAAGYQWLAGGDTTTRPNVGAEDCHLLVRSIEPEVAGLRLPPGVATRFFVRSIAPSGRLSFTASTVVVTSPATPPELAVLSTRAYDLSTQGSIDNLAWDAADGRLELVDASSPGTWTSPVEDLGAERSIDVAARLATSNDTRDISIQLAPLRIPSIAADQFGLVTGGQTGQVGMLFPPYPESELSYQLEIRTSIDGVAFGAWSSVGLYAVRTVTARFVQVRVRLGRQQAPYRPGLRVVSVVLSG
ncbi:MAG: phage tail protein [Planctomycetota bacterium]